MAIILFLLLSVLLIVVFLVDFIPQFYTWQSRIHIGRWKNQEDWHAKLISKSRKWLKKTPTIKLTDNNRLIIIDILKGNYKRDAIQHWQEAALILGLTNHYYTTSDGESKKAIDRYLQKKINNGNWNLTPTEIDGVILSYAFLNINWIDHQVYKPAYDAMFNLIKNLVGDDGTAQYRKTMKNYRYVDTIGFICPFLVSYGIRFNNEDAVDLAVRQIAEFNKHGMYQHEFIPCHTYQVESKLAVGLFGWGRGLGWYAIGLIDAWKALPDSHPKKELLTESVVRFAKMATRFQQPNGGWNWIVTSKEARTDSSTTATLAWFLVNASSLSEIDNVCRESVRKALDYLKSVTKRSGAVDFSQGDTKAIGVHSQEFDILPFTQGFALRTINF